MLTKCVCGVCGRSTHQGGFDANALGGLESQGQIPDLKKNKPLDVEGLPAPHPSAPCVLHEGSQGNNKPTKTYRSPYRLIMFV